MARCHDCNVQEGELHKLGCDMERCPFCGNQLIACGCCYEKLDINCSEGTWCYENGLTKDQEEEWLFVLNEHGRIPWIQYPSICQKCGKLWPDLYSVPDVEWKHFIEPRMRNKIICWECYEEIKELIEGA